jgi:hypothetical protein
MPAPRSEFFDQLGEDHATSAAALAPAVGADPALLY